MYRGERERDIVALILRLFTRLALAYFFNVSFITSKETKKGKEKKKERKKKNNAIARLRVHAYACIYTTQYGVLRNERFMQISRYLAMRNLSCYIRPGLI